MSLIIIIFFCWSFKICCWGKSYWVSAFISVNDNFCIFYFLYRYHIQIFHNFRYFYFYYCCCWGKSYSIMSFNFYYPLIRKSKS
nr:NADH dehydrogenase subunit 4L [Actornithophilus hoplopteri]